MFGGKRDGGGEQPPANPRGRAGLYAVCALYLGYLLYRLLSPLVTGVGQAPPGPALALGVPVLGGGMVFLLVFAWKLYRAPVPRDEGETPEEEEPEDSEP